jgi:hypothetical protein
MIHSGFPRIEAARCHVSMIIVPRVVVLHKFCFAVLWTAGGVFRISSPEKEKKKKQTGIAN